VRSYLAVSSGEYRYLGEQEWRDYEDKENH